MCKDVGPLIVWSVQMWVPLQCGGQASLYHPDSSAPPRFKCTDQLDVGYAQVVRIPLEGIIISLNEPSPQKFM